MASMAIVTLALFAVDAAEDAATGDVSTVAGTGLAGSNDGPGATATPYSPSGVVADSYGNVFVADQGNNMIRKITRGAMVSTFAGSLVAGTADGQGTASTIRRISLTGLVSTFAGTGTIGYADGQGTAAMFHSADERRRYRRGVRFPAGTCH